MATDGKRKIFTSAMPCAAIEAVTTGAVRPGSLCEQSASGAAESNDAATVFGRQSLFADYDILGAGDVDTSIPSGSTVVMRPLLKGETANLLVATGQNITSKGRGLSSNGDGTLKLALTNGTEKVVAYSDEIINTGSVTLVAVRGA